MQDLKKIIYKNILRLSIVMIVLILLVAVYLQVLLVQDQTRDNAQATFAQVEQILAQNKMELAQVEADYREACLLNAETIAYIIQHHPEILGNVEEFRRLARMMQVDEIHIFDDTGCIFTGTHPEYYNFTFDTGEQIGFFRPMMEDKTLRLCQDITPNTAEGKLVQYSALWSADGRFIVQVGMYPETVLKETEKNELSYIFSLLQGNPGVDLYAIDAQTEHILGSTTGGDNGRHMEQIGFSLGDIDRCRAGGHLTVSGVNSYCVFTEMEGTMIGYVISQDLMYKNIPLYTLLLVLCLTFIQVTFVAGMRRFLGRYIIDSIDSTNETLRAVTQGDLEARADVHTSREFAELSSHINTMVRTLLANTGKMSFILNHTNMRIGVYEYGRQMKTVRCTDHVPGILGLDREELTRLTADSRLFEEHIRQLCREPLEGEENVYCVNDRGEKYIRMEEIENDGDCLGIVLDVTEEIETRRRIENERDIDHLTGLYNRFGLEREMARLFADPNSLGSGALIMIDSDGLKEVNDVYGHAVGDLYIKRIAEIIEPFGTARNLAARQSGDEFVLILHGYGDDSEVQEDLVRFRELQRNAAMTMEDGTSIPVRFSYGYVLTQGRRDYATMLSEADGYMYAVKRQRKRALARAQEDGAKKIGSKLLPQELNPPSGNAGIED